MVATALFTVALPGKRRFHALLLARLQIERVTLDVLNNVFLQDFAFEALQCAFQAFAVM